MRVRASWHFSPHAQLQWLIPSQCAPSHHLAVVTGAHSLWHCSLLSRVQAYVSFCSTRSTTFPTALRPGHSRFSSCPICRICPPSYVRHASWRFPHTHSEPVVTLHTPRQRPTLTSRAPPHIHLVTPHGLSVYHLHAAFTSSCHVLLLDPHAHYLDSGNIISYGRLPLITTRRPFHHFYT